MIQLSLVRPSAVILTLLVGCTFALGQQIASLDVSPNPMSGGGTANGTVSLSKAAGANGIKISLTSSETAAMLPASVLVPSGATSATFSISASPVKATTKVTIKGTDPSHKSADASLTIDLPAVRLTGLAVSPTTITASANGVGTVTLSADAPAQGFEVSLSSSKSSATVPSSVTVEGGSKTATFPIVAHAVTAEESVTINAVDPSKYSESAAIKVNIPAVRLTGISFASESVTAANPVKATVELSENAPSDGFVVSLTTAAAFISVPASVTVKAGSKTATFTVVTKPVASAGTATVSASDENGYAKSASLTVKVPTVRLTGLTIGTSSISSGSSATATVTLSAAAPSAGFTIALSTMQSFLSIPMSVSVKGGSTSATFTLSATSVSSANVAKILASDSNEYPASASITVTPQVAGYAVSMTNTTSFNPKSITVPAGGVVVWTNVSGFMVHTVDPDATTAGMSSDGQYPQGIPPTSAFSWTVPASAKSGTTYYYHCRFHGSAGNGSSIGPGMAGVIIVK